MSGLNQKYIGFFPVCRGKRQKDIIYFTVRNMLNFKYVQFKNISVQEKSLLMFIQIQRFGFILQW